MKLLYPLIILISFSFFGNVQAQSIWTDVDAAQVAPGRSIDQDFSLTASRTMTLNLSALRGVLRDAPMEFTANSRSNPLVMDLPLPDGTMQSFEVVESPIMEEGLAAKYDYIKTFSGIGVENDRYRVRFDYNDQNFTATIISPKGTAIITQFAEDLTDLYVAYWLKDVSADGHDHEPHGCELHGSSDFGQDLQQLDNQLIDIAEGARDLGIVDLQTYRFACATTGNYSNSVAGGTIASVQANIVSITNQLNVVYENEVSIRFILIDNNDLLYYFDAANDPYENGNLPVMIDQNHINITNVIGTENFDIGHVYGTNSGGLASLASACSDTQKGRAGSAPFGLTSGANFFLVVAHEKGHQFSARHIFNNCDGDNETDDSGYEPGAGSTIMGYSGASTCGSQWIDPPGDPYFHNHNLEQMMDFSRNESSGGSCPQIIVNDNEMPVVTLDYDNGFFIPISTPFKLTASATDADNAANELTYCWEQFNFDNNNMVPLGSPAGNSPLFRSRPPVSEPTRILPQMETIVFNLFDETEVLPDYSRDISFRCTVRDNDDEGGAYGFEQVDFESTESAGPFLVSSPNEGTETWEIGDYVEVTWDVANTDNDLVNCQKVNIHLSLDGGFTYPIELLANTDNDGSAFVNVPEGTVSTQARVRVEAADNIFFDISNANFDIIETQAAGFTFTADPQNTTQICLPDVLEVTLETSSLLNFENEIALSVVSGLPAGAVATFNNPTVLPGVQSILSIDFSDVTEEGFYEIAIEGTADGADTETRFVYVETVYNDFSALEGITPNAAGTTLLPTFDWTGIPHADGYLFQLSDSPTFDNIIFDYTGTDNSIVSDVTLEAGIQYFWRIQPLNECSPHAFAPTVAFQTEALVCNEATSEDTPIVIPATGLTTTPSTISISDNGEIDQLTIKNIKGFHQGFSDIKFRLEHNGETTEFINTNFTGGSPNCFSGDAFEFGYSTVGTSDPMDCPPTGGQLYQLPASASFAGFTGAGSDAAGDWTLSVVVVEDFDAVAGQFESWTLEYCGVFPTSDPFVSVLEMPCVPPLGTRSINPNNLVIGDDDNASFELIFTLLSIPAHGNLLLNGTALNIGDTFTQSDVDNAVVQYQNTNPDVADDTFAFTVTDGNGGFLGSTSMTIEILEDGDCFVNTTEIDAEQDVLLYPNPAKESFVVDFKKVVNGKVQASIIDVQGRVISTQQLENVFGKIQFETADLASGVYFVHFQTESTVFAKKVTIE